MKKIIMVTDLTRMSKLNVCVAGYTDDGLCIRPVLPHGPLKEKWLWPDADGNKEAIIRPFAVIEIDVLDRRPAVIPPHTEDWPLRTFQRTHHRLLTDDQRRTLLDRTLSGNVEAIFGAPLHGDVRGYVTAGEGLRSLGTIAPKSIRKVHFDEKYGTYRLDFVDYADNQYDLAVNDMAFRDYLHYSRIKTGKSPHELAEELTSHLKPKPVYLRIGLARHFPEQPDRCYLQITGVYSFPDYLEGRCFADFAIEGDS